MCYNAGIELINPLGDRFPPLLRANAMQRPLVPVRTVADPGQWQPMRWLLVPPGVSTAREVAGLKIWLANARIEELEQKPLFRPLLRQNRCVVRFSWFYEWRHEPGGRTRTMYRLALSDGTAMVLPGLFRVAMIEGSACPTFTVCTMEARGIMRYIHNTTLRQPVVVDEQGAQAWLDESLPVAEARGAVLARERSADFVPDPPVREDS
ncbi:MAG: hypothetical protein EA427_15960 [Spirochaetaceae bacterium]|nr:MAG: hypothetical protein EA427_15960 [Spirochaetaceae bacterium]